MSLKRFEIKWQELSLQKPGIKVFLLGFCLFLILISLIITIPDPLFQKPYATVLESREGRLLGARIASDGQWRFPPVDALPENIRTCFLQFEDQYFYIHPGINPVSIFRALKQNIQKGHIVSGGSTITMQTARMALGNRPRTIKQKLIEIWLALRIEIRYSKKEILNIYASNAPFGGNAVGISAASWRYFGRPVQELSWAEAANLVVLPNAPGLIFPGKKDEVLLEKRNRLLAKLLHKGKIDSLTYNLAVAEPLAGKPKPLPMHAMHLLDRNIKEGASEKTIKSTLNYNLQLNVNQIVNDNYLNLKFNHIYNAAALVIDIKTGQVLAYTGNAGYRDPVDHGQEVDIITSRRSPGSLLKPFLYAMAIDDGLITPKQLLPDIPIYFQGFAPRNFDKQFRGAVPAHLALRSSLNVPFVSLLREYGYEKFHFNLLRLGLSSLDQAAGHYGLSIILGGGEVTLWEVAGLYAGLARNLEYFNNKKGAERYNECAFQPLSFYLNEQNTEKKTAEYAISAAATWHTLQAMQMLRRPDTQSNWQQFGNSRAIAWKTGTSYGYKDGWAIGMNSNYLVASWVGNADGEGRPGLTGVAAAAPLMFSIFEILGGEAVFNLPDADMAQLNICKKSGRIASDICPETEVVPVAKESLKTARCTYHKNLHLDATQSFLVHSGCYPVNMMVTRPWFMLPPSQAWFYKRHNADFSLPPVMMDACSDYAQGKMEMIYPRNFTKVFVPVEIDGVLGRVVFEAAHYNPDAKIFWYLDDQFVGETSQNHQLGLFPEAGLHLLSLVDEQGRELSVPFEAINDRGF